MVSRAGSLMLKEFPKEFSKSIGMCPKIIIERPIDKIVIAGMGGSSFHGAICKSYLEDHSFDIPLELCRDYSLNRRTTEMTLVLVSSFSGNTDEAVNCYSDALDRKCRVVVISSGGRLLDLALKDGTPLVRILDNPSPGHHVVSTGYFVGITLCILEGAGLFCGAVEDLRHLEVFLLGLKVRGRARAIAQRIANRIPLIYTTTRFEECIARPIKIRLNENAKTPAFYNVFPELTHYEPLSYSLRQDDFHFVIVEDPSDRSKAKAHIAAFEEVFARKNNVSMTKVVMEGENMLQKIVGVLFLFEWIALYLADIHGVDPFSLETTEELKSAIAARNNSAEYHDLKCFPS